MSDMMNSEDIAARTEKAVTAAVEAGRELGLDVADPEVLYDVFSVIVHLKPSPVVVRVPTVLPKGWDDPESQAEHQRLELAVTAWLAERELPVVVPSPLVPREPVQHDGYSMTFWEYVETDPEATPDFSDADSIARLHHALADFEPELPFLSQVAMIQPCLDALEDRTDLVSEDDLDRARREWEVLKPVVSSLDGLRERFPDATVQPLHGDSPLYNRLVTKDGTKLYADFEEVTFGPPEWDVAMMGEGAVAAYDQAAVKLGLRTLDPRVLAVMDAVRMVQVVACFALVPHLPALGEGLKPSLAQWRMMPFAGGLSAKKSESGGGGGLRLD